MKVLLTENQLKQFIENKLGLDLDDKIHMITSKYDLPREFHYAFAGDARFFNQSLNYFGPMYVIETPEGKFLYHNRNGKIRIYDENDTQNLSPRDVLRSLGISPYWGFDIDDLINIYF